MKVRLETAEGKEVYATKLPSFAEAPQGIFYAGLCYIRHGEDGSVIVYRQAFFYSIGPARSNATHDMIEMKDMPDMKDI